jgi:hypothetical protein
MTMEKLTEAVVLPEQQFVAVDELYHVARLWEGRFEYRPLHKALSELVADVEALNGIAYIEQPSRTIFNGNFAGLNQYIPKSEYRNYTTGAVYVFSLNGSSTNQPREKRAAKHVWTGLGGGTGAFIGLESFPDWWEPTVGGVALAGVTYAVARGKQLHDRRKKEAHAAERVKALHDYLVGQESGGIVVQKVSIEQKRKMSELPEWLHTVPHKDYYGWSYGRASRAIGTWYKSPSRLSNLGISSLDWDGAIQVLPAESDEILAARREELQRLCASNQFLSEYVKYGSSPDALKIERHQARETREYRAYRQYIDSHTWLRQRYSSAMDVIHNDDTVSVTVDVAAYLHDFCAGTPKMQKVWNSSEFVEEFGCVGALTESIYDLKEEKQLLIRRNELACNGFSAGLLSVELRLAEAEAAVFDGLDRLNTIRVEYLTRSKLDAQQAAKTEQAQKNLNRIVAGSHSTHPLELHVQTFQSILAQALINQPQDSPLYGKVAEWLTGLRTDGVYGKVEDTATFYRGLRDCFPELTLPEWQQVAGQFPVVAA